jgi:hypothetical protein
MHTCVRVGSLRVCVRVRTCTCARVGSGTRARPRDFVSLRAYIHHACMCESMYMYECARRFHGSVRFCVNRCASVCIYMYLYYYIDITMYLSITFLYVCMYACMHVCVCVWTRCAQWYRFVCVLTQMARVSMGARESIAIRSSKYICVCTSIYTCALERHRDARAGVRLWRMRARVRPRWVHLP